MAQRNTPSAKGARNRPGGKPGGGSPSGKGSPAKGTSVKSPGQPPKRKPNKSIVNQRQTPWGLIGVTAAIVAFAVAIVVVVVVTHKSSGPSKSAAGADVSDCTKMTGTSKTTYLNENKCAMAIQGVTFKQEPNRNHVTSTVAYDSSPPVGGNHSQYWANCDGTVYSAQIANENAVHMLEHGAVWITYNPATISSGDLKILKKQVTGQDREALSPYAGLKTPISLQAWGYQLFLKSASDPRLLKFVNTLRYNPKTTPELNASCSDPYFDPAKSTPGHPQV